MEEKKIIIGNWKMNPTTLKEAKSDLLKIKKAAGKLTNVQSALAVPSVFIGSLSKEIKGHRFVLGAQDVFWEDQGSFTGEVSAKQLLDFKVTYCIVGHSERRALGETDEMVNKKVKSLLKSGIVPVLCIGESERDEMGNYLKFVAKQVKSVLKDVSKKDLLNIVFVYEPIWAISTHATGPANPAQCFEMVIHIKKVITDLYKLNKAPNITILYGGSANEENAESFLVEGGVNGLLPGRASLNPKSFISILKIANKINV
jgi:triosephosphate isomerase